MLKLLVALAAVVAAFSVARSARAGDAIAISVRDRLLNLDVHDVDGRAFIPMAPVVEAFGAKLEAVADDTLSVCVEDDVCSIVRTDGTDDRIAGDGDARLVALSAVPELFRAHFDWNDASDVIALAPGADPGAARIGKGDPMPDVTLPDMDGAPVALSGYRGKRVIMYTWASW
ncbi:hypothetical protein HN371_12145 [Candidatus Poribacteria bacterium]|nr:hypothetical protein [Candidatus Poribacteria bacterium]MBT5535673.1 hypothetical protein [Candidatus Poribacteria bacterium]MBT5713371.1 hypothetical protein [Candidatus Poribacteria bacterium]MBT7100292.1 hypothetical protein [Candidatus Poribacteria bacterium]MBT7808795.1 hypothetical protein [Candidatus Poribacteria bacterium]